LFLENPRRSICRITESGKGPDRKTQNINKVIEDISEQSFDLAAGIFRGEEDRLVEADWLQACQRLAALADGADESGSSLKILQRSLNAKDIKLKRIAYVAVAEFSNRPEFISQAMTEAASLDTRDLYEDLTFKLSRRLSQGDPLVVGIVVNRLKNLAHQKDSPSAEFKGVQEVLRTAPYSSDIANLTRRLADYYIEDRSNKSWNRLVLQEIRFLIQRTQIQSAGESERVLSRQITESLTKYMTSEKEEDRSMALRKISRVSSLVSGLGKSAAHLDAVFEALLTTLAPENKFIGLEEEKSARVLFDSIKIAAPKSHIVRAHKDIFYPPVQSSVSIR
jgi:hypothetical protein